MNRAVIRIIAISGVAALSAFTFWLGKCGGAKAAFERGAKLSQNSPAPNAEGANAVFERGAKLERERAAWLRAADSNFFVKQFDAGRTDELRENLENGMWISIVRLDELIQNPDASADDRKAAGNVMANLVAYFHEHPKAIKEPERSRISKDVEKRLKDEEAASNGDPSGKKVLGELRDASKGPMQQLDGVVDTVRQEANKLDLETLEVLNRHIANRNFPGRSQSAAGVTFMIPSDSGRGSSSDEEFHYTGKKIRVLYEAGRLKVNDQEFGRVEKGATVDLRLLGRVFVDDVERHPENLDAEHAAPSDGDKPSD